MSGDLAEFVYDMMDLNFCRSKPVSFRMILVTLKVGHALFNVCSPILFCSGTVTQTLRHILRTKNGDFFNIAAFCNKNNVFGIKSIDCDCSTTEVLCCLIQKNLK